MKFGESAEKRAMLRFLIEATRIAWQPMSRRTRGINMETIINMTALLTVTVVSVHMGLLLNWALLSAVLKAMNRSRTAARKNNWQKASQHSSPTQVSISSLSKKVRVRGPLISPLLHSNLRKSLYRLTPQNLQMQVCGEFDSLSLSW